MPRAQITMNGTTGSKLDAKPGVLVQLGNSGVGGETTYLWEIVYQPPGTADSLSSTAIPNPTLTPSKEGTYVLKLTVNPGIDGEQEDVQIVGLPFLKSGVRAKGAGEELQADPVAGWVAADYSVAQLVDRMRADPGLCVGLAGTGGLGRGDVLRATGAAQIKSGLPGQETLPVFEKALASSVGNAKDCLFVLESGVDGSTSPAGGALLLLRFLGRFASVTGSAADGSAVYLSDTGGMALAAGSNVRRIGTVFNAGGSSFDVLVCSAAVVA